MRRVQGLYGALGFGVAVSVWGVDCFANCVNCREVELLLLLLLLRSLSLLLLLLLAAVASAAARGGAQKCASRRAALCKNMLSSAFRIVFVRCFPVCVCVASFFTVFLPTLDFLHMSFSSVPGLGGVGGDDVRANATFAFCFFGSPCSGLFCCGTLAGRGGGVGGGGDDVQANATFVFCFLCSPCSGLFWCGTLVGRGGGCGGGGGDDVHASATFVFCFLCSPCSWCCSWCGTWRGACTHDDASDVADAAIVFYDQMTIVLATDDHEHDSVAPCWPCCKVTLETLPVALSTRACRFLLLHFGNVHHAKTSSF